VGSISSLRAAPERRGSERCRRHRPAVVGRPSHVADRGRGRRGRGGRGLDRIVGTVGAGERRLGLGHTPDRRRERRDRDPGLGDATAVVGDDGGRPDDRDLHLTAVLETDVARPGAGGRRRHVERDEQLVRSRRRRSGADPQLVEAHRPLARRRTQNRLRVEAQERTAGVHRRRRVHHVAADRPLRPRRVRPDDRGRVGQRRVPGPDLLAPLEIAVRHQRPEPDPGRGHVDRAEPVDPVDRHDRLGQRGLPLSRADHEIGAARDGSRA
jgi:hypothetical protein